MFNRTKTPWPPEEYEDVLMKMKEWAAWYSGDSQRLLNFYTGRLGGTRFDASGRFWQKLEEQERAEKIHLPLASDIAKFSAGLLFSDNPRFVVEEADIKNPDTDAVKTQERLREIVDKNNTYSSLVEAAESASALGGSYLKINWDKDIADVPLLRVAQADSAIPKFRYGYLIAVTFHKTVADTGGAIYRHLEIHSKGVIENKLFKGTSNDLGKEIPLTELEETKDLPSRIETGIDDILVRYIPNDLPNRMWRDKPLGNSDLQGLEGLLDSLDEVYTSWMREIRLSKAEKVVPESWLVYNDNSNKLEYRDKMTYTGLNVPSDEMNKPELIQPQLRNKSYAETAMHLIERIVSSAGYAPQSFGINIKQRAESGTALRVRERRSLKTKAKKESYFRQPLEEILRLILEVDNRYFNSNINPEYKIRVEFADTIQDDPSEISESIRNIEQAQAMSIEQKVRYLHPSWSDSEIMREVEKIREEKGILVSSNNEGDDEVDIPE